MSPFDKVYRTLVFGPRCPKVQVIFNNKLVTAELIQEQIKDEGDDHAHYAIVKIPRLPTFIEYPIDLVIFDRSSNLETPCSHKWEKKVFMNDVVYECNKCHLIETDRV